MAKQTLWSGWTWVEIGFRPSLRWCTVTCWSRCKHRISIRIWILQSSIVGFRFAPGPWPACYGRSWISRMENGTCYRLHSLWNSLFTMSWKSFAHLWFLMNRKLFFRVRDQRRLKFGQEFQRQMKMFLLNEFTQSRFLCVFIKGGSVNLESV